MLRMSKQTEQDRAKLRLNRWYEKRYRERTEWVTYFIQGELTGRIKIGKTKNLPQRLKTLQMESPDKLTVLWSHKGNVEKTLHIVFSSLRLHGEWFSPGQELLDFIADNRS